MDRGICNPDWQSLFPKAGVRHLVAPNSDHNLILLDTHLESSKGSRPFRFEEMWARDESSIEVVEKAWAIPVEGSQNLKLMKRIHNVHQEFISWNRQVFGYAKTRIKELEDHLKELQDLPPSQENLSKEAALNLELNEWFEREEVKWR